MMAGDTGAPITAWQQWQKTSELPSLLGSDGGRRCAVLQQWWAMLFGSNGGRRYLFFLFFT
jgi:hypothetical protein